MRYFSLFSGIGGFELGIQNAHLHQATREQQGRLQPGMSDDRESLVGMEQPTCVGFSEIDKYATQIYQSRFPEHKNYGDITKINEQDLPDFDLLCGGFPCQSFSIAGKRGGFSDTRGTLFFDIARILKAKRPRLLLLENVKGLLSHDEGRTFATIVGTLDELGYDLQWEVLNSKDFGVPQNRERVLIVGHSRGTPRPQVFPFGESNESAIKVHSRGKHQQDIVYSPDGIIRRLTPTECERLQGFPDGWTEGVSDAQRYKCLGNAVTTNVIEAVISRMI